MTEGAGLSGVSGDTMVYTVSELALTIRQGIDRLFPSFLAIEGELSNVKLSQPAGHYYFTLKDAASSLKGVMFRGAARSLSFVPVDGLKVLVRGRVSYYEPRGEVQIVAESMGPAGLGLFHLEFRRVREILEREGLLAPDRKRPIPGTPRAVGLITSPQGAAIWDFLRICDQQNRLIPVVVIPARMQGSEAAGDIIRALAAASSRPGIDVVVITRGGGSAEDLWVFNREEVARAILASPVPVVTAIGHEVDVTVADLAADLRVATPTEAAKKVFFDEQPLLQMLARSQRRLAELMAGRVEREGGRLLSFRISAGTFSRRISQWRLIAIRAQDRMVSGLKETLSQRRRALGIFSAAVVHPSRRLVLISKVLNEKKDALGRSARALLFGLKSSVYFIHRKINRDSLVDTRSRRLDLLRYHHDLAARFRHTLSGLGERQTLLSLRLKESDPGRPMSKGFFLLLRDRDLGVVSSENMPSIGELLSARTQGLKMKVQVREILPDEGENPS